MQEIQIEVLRSYASFYLIWYAVCTIGCGLMEYRRDGFKLYHIVSAPVYGFLVSFMVPILLISLVGFIDFIYHLIVFVITGEL